MHIEVLRTFFCRELKYNCNKSKIIWEIRINGKEFELPRVHTSLYKIFNIIDSLGYVTKEKVKNLFITNKRY